MLSAVQDKRITISRTVRRNVIMGLLAELGTPARDNNRFHLLVIEWLWRAAEYSDREWIKTYTLYLVGTTREPLKQIPLVAPCKKPLPFPKEERLLLTTLLL